MADSSLSHKLKIEPYLKHLLKENAPHIVIFVVLVALTFVAVPISWGKYQEHATTASKLEGEVKTLREKAKSLDTLLATTPQDLSGDVKIMQTLIPDVEDYFSIIYSLDQLSASTNFIIVSYQINLQESQEGVLALSITGVGDSEAFIEFLKKYNFEGGRLMTAKSITLTDQEFEGISLAVSFYSKPVDVKDNTGINYVKSLKRLQELKDKVSFVVREDAVGGPGLGLGTEATGSGYPTKSDPF